MAGSGEDLKDILSHYEGFDEHARLSTSPGRLEFTRSKEILKHRLPPPPAVILDVGGGTGPYSCWLAREGYEVYLVDPVARHVEQAKVASEGQPDAPIAGCRIGDARSLEFPDSFADAFLSMGPMYHLVRREDRLTALHEVHRTLKRGGLLFAVAISRYASVIDGLVHEFIRDPDFVKIMNRDLKEGQHRNPTENLAYFTDSYFHHPDELRGEIEEVGLEHIETVAVDGLAYMIPELDSLWRDKSLRKKLLHVLRQIETEPSLLGASPHIMGIARKRV